MKSLLYLRTIYSFFVFASENLIIISLYRELTCKVVEVKLIIKQISYLNTLLLQDTLW